MPKINTQTFIEHALRYDAWAMELNEFGAQLAAVREYDQAASHEDADDDSPTIEIHAAAPGCQVSEEISAAVRPAGGKVAVIGVRGGIYPDKAAAVGRMVRESANNNDVGAIVLAIDSPGGTVHGTPELGDLIFDAKAAKPIYAVAEPEAYSAAYWIGSQATKLFATKSGGVGSIGVWSAHMNMADMLKQMGIDITLVKAGKFKVEGHPFGPLDEEAQAEMQRSVDFHYANFIDAVARGRGVARKTVAGGFGEGRTVRASDALDMGMIDGIMGLDTLLAALLRDVKGRRAEKLLAMNLAIEEAE